VHINNDIRIMVLCNNEMAIPALQQLFMSGSLSVVIIPEKNKALLAELKPLLTGTNVSIVGVNKKSLESVIKRTAAEKNITAAWLMTFAYIIPKSLLNLLPGGFINFHYGLLPQYRGANPVLAQMLNGETHNGITVHIVDENIDTGPVVMQQKIAIGERDTFGIQLHKLGMLGASMAMNLLQVCRLSLVPPSVPQDESKAKYYPKPVAADLMINWNNMSSQQVIRLINTCNPWNKGAGAIINNMIICLTDAELINETYTGNVVPGSIIALDEEAGLKIYCFDNKVIKINVICTPQGFFAGKRLADYGIKINDRFLSPN
jgi:methionyl-tRNA formyltransferase